MQEILKEPDKAKSTDEIVEWLVKCAQQKCTRWKVCTSYLLIVTLCPTMTA
jgi:hypothetical protein